MRRLTLTLAVALASTLLADGRTVQSGKARVFVDDHVVFANGVSDVRLGVLQFQYGKTFLYVERGAKAYVVTDGGTLDRVRQVLVPQVQLGQQQAALGSKQAALGSKQAALGEEQARIGIRQISASEAERPRLEQRQADLGRQQQALGEQQQKLGEQQQKLGDRQQALQRQSDARIDDILDQAISRGLATQVK